MSIRKLRAGRAPGVTAAEYVGQIGTIFWDEGDGTLHLSDGVTPGGTFLSVQTFTTQNIPAHPADGNLWFDSVTGKLYIWFDNTWVDTQPQYALPIATNSVLGGVKSGLGLTVNQYGTASIDAVSSFAFVGNKLSLLAATDTVIGGVKLGPGVTTNDQGQIIIDSAGLNFSFGDFYAFTNPGPTDGACLSSVNANQDVNLVSNGTGSINIVGDFHVHKTDDNLENELAANPVFAVDHTGQIRILIPNSVTSSGGVEIIGNAAGTFQTPVNTGVMLHITGNAPDGSPTPSRIYNDAIAGYSGWIGRRYNGTSASPTAVLAGEEVLRLGANAYTGSGWNTVGSSNIRFVSTDNQALGAAQGMKIDFYSTPQGSGVGAITKVMSVEAGVGVTATQFNGPLTGDVTGNVSGNAGTVTNGVYTTGSYSDPNWLTISKTKVGLSNVENTALSTSTYYIGTTQNTYGRASAAQTLTGVSISGNAGTVTNGVYTTGSYSDPSWLSISATKVGLGNVTNESKATMFSSPTFTGTVSGVTKAMVGLGSVENTALSTWAGTTNITTVGTLTNLAVSGTIRYDIAQSVNGVQPATPTNVKTNPVTANGRSGTITTNNASISQSTAVTFTVNNTSVSANDVIILNIQSGATADTYSITVTSVRTNAFDVQIRNFTNSAKSDTIILNYAVIKVS